MTEQAGSYAFGQFTSNDAELERLKQQAEVGWRMEKKLLAQAGVSPLMDVLDMACGPGFITSRIADMVAPDGSVLGIDLNDDLLAVAQERAERMQVEYLTYRKMNVYNLELPERSFDFAYARFLFQHLEHPQRAVEQAWRALRVGGRIAITDVDDGILAVYPEPTGFREFVTLAAECQQHAGGDRHVGRKLGYFLKQAGFEDIRIEVRVITSDTLGMKKFLDITTGFKREMVPPEQSEETLAALDRIYRDALQPESFALAGVYFVTARKV